MVHLFPDADLEAFQSELEALGLAATLGVGPHFSRAGVRTTARRLVAVRERLAAMDEVFWLSLAGGNRLLNDTARMTLLTTW